MGSKSSGSEIPPGFEGVNKPLDPMIVEVKTRNDTPFEERVCGHIESGVYAHERFKFRLGKEGSPNTASRGRDFSLGRQ